MGSFQWLNFTVWHWWMRGKVELLVKHKGVRNKLTGKRYGVSSYG